MEGTPYCHGFHSGLLRLYRTDNHEVVVEYS